MRWALLLGVLISCGCGTGPVIATYDGGSIIVVDGGSPVLTTDGGTITCGGLAGLKCPDGSTCRPDDGSCQSDCFGICY